MAETQVASSPTEMEDPFNGETPTLREFNNYRVTGEVPERFKKAEPAAAAPADTPEQTANSESAPATEPESTQEQPHKVSGAEKRIKQLLAEKKALEAQLAAQAKPDAQTASSPAPQVERANPSRPEPKITDTKPDGTAKYTDYETFYKDLGRWTAEQVLQEAHQRDEQRRQSEKIQENIEEARRRYGDDFEGVIEPAAGSIMANQAIPVEIKRMMAQSDVLPELVFTLGTDPKAMKELERVAQTDPTRAMRYIATLEAGIRQELESSEETPAATAPEPKQTNAPKPPSPVSGPSSRAFDVSDESLSAVEWARKRNAQLAARGRS